MMDAVDKKSVLKTVETDSNGEYWFKDIAPGRYVIKPVGIADSKQNSESSF